MTRPLALAVTVAVLCALAACNGRKSLHHDVTETEDTIAIVDSLDEEYTGDEAMEEAEENLSATADELFDDFIFSYLSSHRLQMERTDLPLPVECDSTVAALPPSIGRREWKTLRLFLDDGEYTIMFDSEKQMELAKDTAINTVTVEHINSEERLVDSYIFSRSAGQWRLRRLRREPLDANVNATFIDFYARFATDSTFQRQSLSHHIAFTAPDPDDDFARTEGVITPDFWEAFAPEMPGAIQYNIVYNEPQRLSTEKLLVVRGISNGLELDLAFQRHGERWRLCRIAE